MLLVALKSDSFTWGTNRLYLYVHSSISGVWGLVLFYIGVFKTIKFVVGKISTSCAICSNGIVSGLKKDAVCLAIDHHIKLLVQVPDL